MRSGVGFPSFSTTGFAVAAVSGSWDAAFPLANLLDLVEVRRIAQAGSAGARSISFTLPVSSSIGLVSLVHHNLAAGDTVRLRLYSDTNPSAANAAHLVSDTSVTAPAPVSYYAPLLPIAPAAPAVARSGLLDLTTSSLLIIGALDVAGFYRWPDVGSDRQLGFNPQGQRIPQPGGIDANMGQWSPRIMQGTRQTVDRSEADSTFLDFQAETRQSQPFVWVRDADDPSTWAREAFLVKNQPLANPVAYSDPAARVAFNFQEHLG